MRQRGEIIISYAGSSKQNSCSLCKRDHKQVIDPQSFPHLI